MRSYLFFIFYCLFILTACQRENHPQPLSEEDFSISYMNKQINETILPKIDSLLGISNEDVENNYGLVSQGPENGYSRWNLHYPSRTNTEIQITIMGDGHNPLEGDYIAGLQLYTISTARGVKVGDSSEDLINVYGKPSEKTDNKLTYLKGTKKLIFELDNKTISGITIDYEFERAEKDQGFK